jgi:hypothetical protein
LLFADLAKGLSCGPIQAQSWRRSYFSLPRKTFAFCYPLPGSSQVFTVRNPCAH